MDRILHLLKIYVEILTTRVMILGDGAPGKWWGHEGETLMNGISVLVKEPQEGSLALPHYVWATERTAI